MFVVMAASSETRERDLECDVSGETIRNFMEALQAAGQLSADNILQTLKLLEVKVLNNRMTTSSRQKVTDTLVDYLRAVKPEGELEEMCVSVLMALGSQSPEMVIVKLWDRLHLHDLPPRSLLVTVGKLSLGQGVAPYLGATWEHILCLLRMAQEEDDMLAICQALSGLVISTRKHLDLGSKDDEVMDITPEAVSIKAYHTLRILFNHWSLKNKNKVTEQVLVIAGHLFFLMPPSKLKNQVNQLIQWLMTLISTGVTPFYISQVIGCICQLVDALAVSGRGGVNLESQLENVVPMLFTQLHEKVNTSDPYSIQSHGLAMRAFFILTKLHNDQVVLLIRKTLESKDPAKIVPALQVFMEIFQEVPQTETLKREVMHSIVVLIQEDLKPVRKTLLSFLEMLGRLGYLTLSQGDVVIDYAIQLCQSDRSNEEDIQLKCSKILQMVQTSRVPLPKLITLLCQPSNSLAFVPLSKTATEMALRARTLGQVPYLSGFHLQPTQFISPQKLLVHLVMFSLKPYREKEFGVSSLRLLNALHPITSLHPIINLDVGWLWAKEIPKMLQILDGEELCASAGPFALPRPSGRRGPKFSPLLDHTEKTLSQKEWQDRLLQFSSQSLLAISDDNWLEQLLRVILERINYFSDEDEEKAFLYKLFGFCLRTARNTELLKSMLSSILQTAHEELQEREGIAVVLSIVSTKHLKTALDHLQAYGAVLTDKASSFILRLMKEHQPREWGMVCHTIYLCYSKIVSESKAAAVEHLDAILALVLQHYRHCIVEKDKNLKLDYLDALTKLTGVLGSQPAAFRLEFPHKLEMVAFMVELIKEEPLTSISSPIRQKAMSIVTDFRQIRPLLEVKERAELLRACYKSVFCLPPTDVLRKEASSPREASANVFLDMWLNSQKDSERERAMWCTACILGFTAKMNNFETEIEFTRLGRLVRLLAVRCQDPVDNICFLSAQAVYSLYCILLQQKKTARKKQGLWEEEGRSEVYSASVFYNSTFEIAEAFAEYFTQMQVTNLVLTAMEGLTNSKAKESLAAAQLMSGVLKERGRDMMKIEEVVEGILEWLSLQLEPSTKEETLRAMCLLAGNNAHIVVPLLLNKPLPWNRTSLSLWKVFGTQRETTIGILQVLIGVLEKLDSRDETGEMPFQPVAVACALCEMLSGSLCQEAVKELYPRLLLAVLHHLCWVIEQKPPQKMVVYTKEGGLGSKSKPFDPSSCALEVVKLVLLAAAYEGVVFYGNQHRSWDLLSCPRFYYMGIMDLTSAMVKNCEPAVLHQLLSLVRNFLYSLDHRWKTLARALYAQLLWHRSVAQTLGHDFLSNLVKWIKEPDLVMKEVGLRGIGNLALHPGQSASLKSLVPSLRDLLKNEVRVTVQAVKSLRNIICHGQAEDTKVVFCSISKHLRPLINDERDQVKISATSALGHMLHQVDKCKPGPSIWREIYTFLVPLLLSIQDNNPEVVKACGGALTEWTKVIGWSSLTRTFRHTTLSDHIQVLEETCKYLVGASRRQLLGELLSQSFGFLKSPQPFLRTAAVSFIELTVKRISMSHLHEDDVQLFRNALERLRDDPAQSVQRSVDTVLKRLDGCASARHVSASRSSQLGSTFFKVPQRKKRLFKPVKWEREDEDQQEKKTPNWFKAPLNLLRARHTRKVRNSPLTEGGAGEKTAASQAPKARSRLEEAGPAPK
ncbi:Maestro heat-like repeat-containing protein family member 1 [Camelus dromedarius]|uniref:Maestro heat-like repeat-containing protein family member 1 n=1 Tax=Camelus dromedarius TaxID=9838 RepID=A0A5N4C5L5_CAMDR|nr:Maestro heat-like repeat-containing protein family member 1 [Camelus dromedarius]